MDNFDEFDMQRAAGQENPSPLTRAYTPIEQARIANPDDTQGMSDIEVARHLFGRKSPDGKPETFPEFATRMGVDTGALETALNTGSSAAVFHLNEPLEAAFNGLGEMGRGGTFGKGYQQKRQ